MYLHFSFFAQLFVYVLVMHMSSLRLSDDDLRVQGLHIRTMISVMQVFVLSLMLLCKVCFTFLIRLIKRDRERFVLVDVKLGFDDKLYAGGELNDDNAHSSSGRIKAPNSITDEAQVEMPRLAVEDKSTDLFVHAEHFQDNIAEIDKLSTCTHTETDSDVSIGTDLQLSIVFDNSSRLDMYIMYISVLGIVLWQSFLSFNFSMYNTCFYFVTGVATGFLLDYILQYCQTKSSQAPLHSLCLIILYATLFCCILSLSWRQTTIVSSGDIVMLSIMYAVAFGCGCFWTFVGSNVAFVEQLAHSQGRSHGVFYDTRRSLPTFWLVMVVNGLCVSPDTRMIVWQYLMQLSRMATLHILLLEPLLKFVSIYIMILTLERKRSLDFVVAMLLVQSMQQIKQNNFQNVDVSTIAMIISATALFSVHVACSLRNKRRVKQEQRNQI
jgi:hypothetical protein